MRLFVAVVPPEAWLDRVAAYAQALQRSADLPRSRWVQPGRHHATLRFLGDTPRAALPGLRAAVDATAEAVANDSAQLGFTTLLAIPPRSPHVLALEPDADSAAWLTQTRARLDRSIADLAPDVGPPEARPFRPHLTLARFKARPPRSLRLVALPAPPRERFAAALALVSSELTPAGPNYTVLAGGPERSRSTG